MTSPLVIFDLDGTLVDTANDIVSSLNFTIAKHQLEAVTYDDLHHIVGQGGRVAIKRAFALRNTPLSEEELEPLYEAFIAHYFENIPGDAKVYEGLVKCLDSLIADGFKLAVCTNKTEALTTPLLQRLKLNHYFSAVTCGDTFDWRKPDARHITSTIELACGDLRRSIMVGDSINDIAAAKNAGIPSIGVSFGYTDVPMSQLEPSVLIDHYHQFTPELARKLIS